MEKRTWHYILPPPRFEIVCPRCQGINITWSEYKRHIWCYDCDDDLHLKTNKLFDGPVPIYTSIHVFGLNFDIYDMESGEIKFLNPETGQWIGLNEITQQITKNMLLYSDGENDFKNLYGEDIFNRIKKYKEFMNDDSLQ